MVLRGTFHVLTFDERGAVTARFSAGEGTASMAYETPRAVWHTLVVDTDGSAFLEVKEGPYDPATASEFTAWAPAEGAAGAPVFWKGLLDAAPGDKTPVS